MIFEAKFSGDFVKQLNKVQSAWQSGQPEKIQVSIRLDNIPFDMGWVYVHEFGSPPHKISASPGGKLVYYKDGGKHIVDAVFHPGNQPLRIVLNRLDTIRRWFKDTVKSILVHNLHNPQALRVGLVALVKEVKELLAEGYDVSLPNFRFPDAQFPKQSGKLQGNTAGAVYRAQAHVIDTSK